MFRHDNAFHSGEFPFRPAFEPAVEERGHNLTKHGVAEKLETLVVA